MAKDKESQTGNSRPSSEDVAKAKEGVEAIRKVQEKTKIEDLDSKELYLMAEKGWNDKEILRRRELKEEGWSDDEIRLAREGWVREPCYIEKEGKEVLIGHKMVLPYEEEFWEVTFHEKAHPNDTKDVELAVEGEVLLIKRGDPVIVPLRFLKAADNGVYDVFQQMPGETRKRVSKVQTYRYTRIKQRSREEYEDMKQEGDRIQTEFRKRQEQLQV
jgi:hypothetical protein